MLGLGWPEWITIISLVGALVLTVWLMAKASVAYDKARRARGVRGGRRPRAANPPAAEGRDGIDAGGRGDPASGDGKEEA